MPPFHLFLYGSTSWPSTTEQSQACQSRFCKNSYSYVYTPVCSTVLPKWRDSMTILDFLPSLSFCSTAAPFGSLARCTSLCSHVHRLSHAVGSLSLHGTHVSVLLIGADMVQIPFYMRNMCHVVPNLPVSFLSYSWGTIRTDHFIMKEIYCVQMV